MANYPLDIIIIVIIVIIIIPYGSKYLLRKCLGYDLGG